MARRLHRLAVATSDRDRRPAGAKPRRSLARELPVLLIVAVVLAMVVRGLVAQAFYIPSVSMQQTLDVDDRVLVNKVVHRLRDVRRGEVVVFHGLDSFSPDPGSLVTTPANPVRRAIGSAAALVGLVPGPADRDFIKRIIGLPGDRVACCTAAGRVTVQPRGSSRAVELDEPYVHQDDRREFCENGLGEASCANRPGVLVPEGRLFVMGDNRSQSSDSRAHLDDGNNGTVPIDQVVGRAFVVVWPVPRAGLLEIHDPLPGQGDEPAR